MDVYIFSTFVLGKASNYVYGKSITDRAKEKDDRYRGLADMRVYLREMRLASMCGPIEVLENGFVRARITSPVNDLVTYLQRSAPKQDKFLRKNMNNLFVGVDKRTDTGSATEGLEFRMRDIGTEKPAELYKLRDILASDKVLAAAPKKKDEEDPEEEEETKDKGPGDEEEEDTEEETKDDTKEEEPAEEEDQEEEPADKEEPAEEPADKEEPAEEEPAEEESKVEVKKEEKKLKPKEPPKEKRGLKLRLRKPVEDLRAIVVLKLDGVVATREIYEDKKDKYSIGLPIRETVMWMRELAIDPRFKIVIYTGRLFNDGIKTDLEIKTQRKNIREFCENNRVPYDDLVGIKPPEESIYIADNVWRFDSKQPGAHIEEIKRLAMPKIASYLKQNVNPND